MQSDKHTLYMCEARFRLANERKCSLGVVDGPKKMVETKNRKWENKKTNQLSPDDGSVSVGEIMCQWKVA